MQRTDKYLWEFVKASRKVLKVLSPLVNYESLRMDLVNHSQYRKGTVTRQDVDNIMFVVNELMPLAYEESLPVKDRERVIHGLKSILLSWKHNTLPNFKLH